MALKMRGAENPRLGLRETPQGLRQMPHPTTFAGKRWRQAHDFSEFPFSAGGIRDGPGKGTHPARNGAPSFTIPPPRHPPGLFRTNTKNRLHEYQH